MTDRESLFYCPRRDDRISFAGYSPIFDSAREGTDKYVNGGCSYCGSMPPSEFFDRIDQGVEIGPTDKGYKVYVEGRRKFYFQHLDADGRQRFIDLVNDGRVSFGYPGHLYVLPYFTRTGGQT